MSLLRQPAVVVTTPPWAKDEPPTPDLSDRADSPSFDRRNADNASCNTDTGPPSRWWTFTLPRTGYSSTAGASTSQSQTRPASVGNRSMTWLTSAVVLRDAAAFARKDEQRLDNEKALLNLRATAQSMDTFTCEQHATSSQQPGRSEIRPRRESSHIPQDEGEIRNLDDDDLNEWPIRRKGLRNYILVNPYVPLLFRFVNMASTSAALGIATHIRQTEIENHVLGAVGSSPMVVIIFAPLTLVHVLVAIYLEYFGRPVGLWRTSAKLAHTLSETLFICAWSAALSLCFDNFFTSLIPCASPSSISWYNELHRSQFPSPSLEISVGHEICDDQVALICLVAFGLLTYCFNLIISLFRIMEKVKIHSEAP